MNPFGGSKTNDAKTKRLNKFAKLQKMFYETQIDEVDIVDV